jgi:predicted RNA-binding protein with PUA-like domain
MNHWLLKSEPDVFSITDLARRPRRTEHWDGVRNYQARNYLRDGMRRGDQAFFYHSNCAVPGIAGIVTIVREGYPDFTALDPRSPYYDPAASPENPRWYMVDVRHQRTFKRVISLQELRQCPALAGMPLLMRGTRLSVMPVTSAQWAAILALE